MNEKALKFENIRVNKKEFQPVDLVSINVNQIVSISGKYFIGYEKDEIVKLLCIIENSSKNMSFFIKDDDVFDDDQAGSCPFECPAPPGNVT